ncbi:hypothetical protein AVEN_166926-1 [Araneus ventricosus]|uniref:Uncharacterized protein n=1 Tax=Araneus ventricosus TaxID=182803 RepID=A0A4Y2LVZ1_ARAVE|nr:hypothetical protein AVEN_166926-1 [Araneus ventricosus]
MIGNPVLPGYDPSSEMGHKSHTTITVPTSEAKTCLLIRQLLIRELAVPSVHEQPLISNQLEQFRSESYALLKQLKRSVQLLNSAPQLAARDSVLLPQIRRCSTPNANAKIGNRSKNDHRSQSTLFSFSPAAA